MRAFEITLNSDYKSEKSNSVDAYNNKNNIKQEKYIKGHTMPNLSN